jgi:hypothetical protein
LARVCIIRMVHTDRVTGRRLRVTVVLHRLRLTVVLRRVATTVRHRGSNRRRDTVRKVRRPKVPMGRRKARRRALRRPKSRR